MCTSPAAGQAARLRFVSMPERKPIIPPEYRSAVVAGVFLGVVAALVVWWLERFETRRVVGEVEQYLRSHAAFTDYLRETGREP